MQWFLYNYSLPLTDKRCSYIEVGLSWLVQVIISSMYMYAINNKLTVSHSDHDVLYSLDVDKESAMQWFETKT